MPTNQKKKQLKPKKLFEIKIKTKRCLLRPATAAEIGLEASPKKNKLKLSAAKDWPTNEFKSGYPYVLEGLKEEKKSYNPWWMWWIFESSKNMRHSILIGFVGFKGAPNKYNEIEITYSICPSYQGKQFAFEACEGIIQ